ncbi:MAG: hypothetical protein OEW73_11380, partial [Gammaproteobacteria bacterium]|nr:hypothetical protein [Gammaproteobacteria bacterium]
MHEALLGLLLILTIAWLVVRVRQGKSVDETKSTRKPRDSGKFHAVAIKYSEHACDAAKALTGRRF